MEGYCPKELHGLLTHLVQVLTQVTFMKALFMDSGAETGLLQGQARRTTPRLPKEGQQSIFKAKGREGHHRACDQLVHNSDWLLVINP